MDFFALRRVFGPKKEEVKWVLRKLHNDELNYLYSPNIRVIKSRRMIWAGHVASIGNRKGT